MIQDKECTVFFGQAGAMVPGGMKQIIIDFLQNKWVDVFVTTGATLTHDIVEALGFKHYQGSAHDNDEKLHKQGYDRMWDSYMQNNVYEKLEKFFQENKELLMQATSIREFLTKLGSITPKESILRTAHDNNIPIFCPALADSGIGLMIWGQLEKGNNFPINAFSDIKEIIRRSLDSKKNGVFYVGGGVPKNFIQQSMQFSKGAYYGVQVSTDVPHYGGSSGAPLHEGISWGKLDPRGEYADLYCDATIALPILHAALLEKIN